MIVLGVSTSSQISSVGLMKDDVLVSEMTMDMQSNWLSELSLVIELVLQRGKVTLHEIDLLSVVLGPGTWTGLRVGVTTVKSLAYTLNRPVVGVCALDVLAYNVHFVKKPVYSLIDAGNHRVYLAGYRCATHIPERFVDYQVTSVDSLADQLVTPCILIGDGSIRYGQALSEIFGDRVILTPASLCTIRITCLVEVAIHQYTCRGPDEVFGLTPMYLQETVYRANPGPVLNLVKV